MMRPVDLKKSLFIFIPLFLILISLFLKAESGRWVRQAQRIVPDPAKKDLTQRDSNGSYWKYTANENSISIDSKVFAKVKDRYSFNASPQIIHVYSWEFAYQIHPPPAVIFPDRLYTLKVTGSGQGEIKVTPAKSYEKWGVRVSKPEARLMITGKGIQIKPDRAFGLYKDRLLFLLDENKRGPETRTCSMTVPAGMEKNSWYKMITLRASLGGVSVEWDYAFQQGGAAPEENDRVSEDNRSDCGKSGALTRYINALRGHQQAIIEMNGELDRKLAGPKPRHQEIIVFGEKAKTISTSFQSTLKEFSAAETRRGLFEELDLILNSVLALNQAVEKYQKWAGVPVTPLKKSIVQNCKANVAQTILKLAREEYASRLESEGLRDILTSESWNEVLEKAAYHTQRKVNEFLDRETEKIFGFGFHDAESARRSLQAQMRREVRRQVAKLLVKITSNEIVIEILAGPVIRWIERELFPRLREALRQKGDLPNRLARSIETLKSARNELNKLPCSAKLREVRRRLNTAAGTIAATRYLERDLLNAHAQAEFNRLDEARNQLDRTMSLTRTRFLLVMDDYEEDLAFAVFVVDQMVKNLCASIPSTVQLRLKNYTAPAIPSLNARITGLKFYEGGYNGVPHPQRRYATSFPASSSRYVFWELNLEYPPALQRIDFKIDSTYFNSQNAFYGKADFNAFIEAGWKDSHHSYAYGYSNPGQWKPGKYRVDLFVAGGLVASGEFIITE